MIVRSPYALTRSKKKSPASRISADEARLCYRLNNCITNGCKIFTVSVSARYLSNESIPPENSNDPCL